MEIIQAVQHLRHLPGTTHSHLLRCSDGNLYVVKFRNNPDGPRVLVNEMLASRLAEQLGLPVPPAAVVYVGPETIAGPKLSSPTDETSRPRPPHVHFGSRYVTAEECHPGWLPQPAALRPEAARAFCGMLAFDKWTCNLDIRQALFFRDRPDDSYDVCFIDHGSCFGGTTWGLRNAPLQGTPHQRELLLGAQPQDFGSWLDAIARLTVTDLFTAAADVPSSWYPHDGAALASMLQQLWLRRLRVRDLVADCLRALKNETRKSYSRPELTELDLATARALLEGTEGEAANRFAAPAHAKTLLSHAPAAGKWPLRSAKLYSP
ncbi:MAG: HipA family kinase [Terriglobales bacterium]